MATKKELIEKCRAKADSLEKRANTIRDVIDSLTAVYPSAYIGREEAYDRLVENNQKQGISPSNVYISATKNDLGFGELYAAVSTFAEKGDPLAQKLLGYCHEKGSDELYSLNKSERIVERMVTRTLTGDEYNKFLREEFWIPF